jgi:hypothetical protein
MLTRKEDEETPYLLVLQIGKDTNELNVLAFIKDSVDKFALKSKTINPAYTEITAEVKLKKTDAGFVSELESNFEIKKATLISYSGDLAQV